MINFFVSIYNYFERHKVLLNTVLLLTLVFNAYFAIKLNFDEDITSFFPDTEKKQTIEVFKKLKIKDKVVVIVSYTDSLKTPNLDSLIFAANSFQDNFAKHTDSSLVESVFSQMDEKLIEESVNLVYDNLPVFVSPQEYSKIDSLLTPKNVEERMQANYNSILSPMGIVTQRFITKDPVGIGANAMNSLHSLQMFTDFEIYNGYIFSKDKRNLFIFITPNFDYSNTTENEKLISGLEQSTKEIEAKYSQINIQFTGTPVIAAYNAQQIQEDTILTIVIALLIIFAIISLAFKNRFAILLIVFPIIYGFIFALCAIYFLNGNISIIAIGSGAVVLGVAMSYSIHILSHLSHVKTIQQLIKELVYPLTIGSFTTIAAFSSLLFTDSQILRDFGLFSSLTLIGTTLFCLVFLPHFLTPKPFEARGKTMKFIEKINAYAFEKNKYVVSAIVLLLIVCIYFSQKVQFDSNMSNLNFQPKHIRNAEQKLNNLFNANDNTVLFVSTGKSFDDCLKSYNETNAELHKLKAEKKINEYSSIEKLMLLESEQKARIDKWNNFWTEEKKKDVKRRINNAAMKCSFTENSFKEFDNLIDKEYNSYDITATKGVLHNVLQEWVQKEDSLTMMISMVRLDEKQKQHVYEVFMEKPSVVIFDRGYFTNKWSETIKDDFNYILYVSAFIVFITLLLSFGRIELALITFVPMLVSWIIIVGLMAIFGIEFNLVNIILSTFIFGIGDDFSIFIMDGLQNEYINGKKTLASHKTAIFLSFITAFVGIGVLVFAKHPALHSVAIPAVIGLLTVLLVSFTVQPILYRNIILSPAKKGESPFTLFNFIIMSYSFVTFFFQAILLSLFSYVLMILPIKKKHKKNFFRFLIYKFVFLPCKMSPFVKKFIKNNIHNETFEKPSVIIANHQSFVDLLIMLSLSPKLILITNNWVWNSPIFGRIVRYADFYPADYGNEKALDIFEQKIKEGFSIVIFPEGTRSEDGKFNRFRKGAFLISEKLKLDILPIVFYGNGMITPKKHPFYANPAILSCSILKRISFDDAEYGNTYQEKSKNIRRFMEDEYKNECKKYATTDNPYYQHKLISNYIYRGPILEWYIRIKLKIENFYYIYHEIIPKQAVITDIGCGYGQLSYMLNLLHKERKVLGIDYDENKIEIANNCFLKNDNISFVASDITICELSFSDIFILNDVLHYLNYDEQKTLLLKCINSLNNGGKIIISEGNKEDEMRHRYTKLTEFCSIKIFKFNKLKNKVNFNFAEDFQKLARQNGMKVEIIKNSNITSNSLYIFSDDKL